MAGLRSAVDGFVRGAADAGLELHGLIVTRHGRVVARGWWDPFGPDTEHLLYSLSKTFTATAYAFAEADGLLDRDRPLIEYWPEHARLAGPRARAWTARTLLRMASGHTTDAVGVGLPVDAALAGHGDLDAVAFCFGHEPDAEPGTVFCYNQLCTYLVAATVQKVTGERLTDYLRPRLFEPLGIAGGHWQADNFGRQLGFTGLHVTLDAVARLGEFYLRRGVAGGVRLLPEPWFDEASRPLSDTGPTNPDGTPRGADWTHGYGYQLWGSAHGYRGDGAFGQFMLVLPGQDAVVAINSAVGDMQAVLDLVWSELLPGLSDEDAPTPLETAGLRLVPEGGAGPAGEFAAASDGYEHAPGWTLPVPVRRLEASPGEGAWTLVLTLGDDTVAVRAGDGAWLPGVLPGREGPVACAGSAGWSDGRFRARIVLTTTPHAVVLTGDPASGTLDARWTVPPLRGTAVADLGLPA